MQAAPSGEGLTSLTTLDLSGAGASDDSLLALNGAPLRHLALSANPGVSAQGVELLCVLGVTSIERLALSSCMGVGDDVWPALAALPSLQHLDLSETAVTGVRACMHTD